mmetsp:Transcript_47120/g.135759  ORF Transcript_47120/g.135759 Transcript_47120/m.135759 type:complete len:203 (-) Transcript_47120:342-950(-)
MLRCPLWCWASPAFRARSRTSNPSRTGSPGAWPLTAPSWRQAGRLRRGVRALRRWRCPGLAPWLGIGGICQRQCAGATPSSPERSPPPPWPPYSGPGHRAGTRPSLPRRRLAQRRPTPRCRPRRPWTWRRSSWRQAAVPRASRPSKWRRRSSASETSSCPRGPTLQPPPWALRRAAMALRAVRPRPWHSTSRLGSPRPPPPP